MVDAHHPPKRVEESILRFPLGISRGNLFLEDSTGQRGSGIRASEGVDHFLCVRICLLYVGTLLLRLVLPRSVRVQRGIVVVVGRGALFSSCDWTRCTYVDPTCLLDCGETVKASGGL